MPAAAASAAASEGADRPLAIELVGISKSFGPVQANKDIHLAVRRGTIHGIVGENGAGKSTLMSILYGFYEADSGEIRIGGRPARIRSSADAIEGGIGMVHQHFMLVPPLTVVENVMLGSEGGSLLRRGEARARAAGSGGASSESLTPSQFALATAKPSPLGTMQMAFLRSSSGTNSTGAALR